MERRRRADDEDTRRAVAPSNGSTSLKLCPRMIRIPWRLRSETPPTRHWAAVRRGASDRIPSTLEPCQGTDATEQLEGFEQRRRTPPTGHGDPNGTESELGLEPEAVDERRPQRRLDFGGSPLGDARQGFAGGGKHRPGFLGE